MRIDDRLRSRTNEALRKLDEGLVDELFADAIKKCEQRADNGYDFAHITDSRLFDGYNDDDDDETPVSTLFSARLLRAGFFVDWCSEEKYIYVSWAGCNEVYQHQIDAFTRDCGYNPLAEQGYSDLG